jgi:hypothetical protein
MLARVTALCSALLALSFAAPSIAQEEESSRFSGVFQTDVTNAYYFRGILQEREGVIIQPWAELYANLYSSEDGFIRDITIGAGMWTSFHSERTLAGYNPTRGTDGGDQNQWWYEADYYPLISVDFAGGLSLLHVYYFYTSPNDAFTTVQEANFKLSWDDSEAFGAFSVQPWVNVAWEIKNTSYGPQEGYGLQAGIAPTLYAAEDESFTLTAPAEIGLSLEDYYEGSNGENHTFGYANVGLAASIPLSFVPEGAGAWSLNLSGKYFFFGHQLESNDTPDTTGNRGRGSYPVGMASVSVAF